MKGNCETCRHWKGGGDLPENWAVCQLTDCEEGERLFPQTLAYAEGRDQEWAILHTHATLECNQWEGKV